MRACRLIILLVASSILPVARLAGQTADPSPAPTSRPAPTSAPAPVTAERKIQLQKLYADLADPDPSVRMAARFDLLKMNIAELDVFRQIVLDAGKPQPAQAIVLRGIVTHCILAHEPYEADRATGMIGVRAVDTRIGTDAQDPNGIHRTGQGPVVISLVPGFCGYASLLEGDMLLATRYPAIPIYQFTDLAEIVRSRKAGDTLQLDVLRQGQVVLVSLTLDPRPITTTSQQLENFVNLRQELGWTRFRIMFAPLLNQTDAWDMALETHMAPGYANP